MTLSLAFLDIDVAPRCLHTGSVAGVVAPTQDDRRHLIRISSSETRLLQLNEISEETKEKMKAFKKDMKGEMEFHADQGKSRGVDLARRVHEGEESQCAILCNHLISSEQKELR